MSHVQIKTNREKVIFVLLLCLAVAVLSACTSLAGENMPTPASETIPATPIPTALAMLTPTADVQPTMVIAEGTPFPFSLDEVSCQFDANAMEDYEHWADALIPGISTVDDLLALTSVPDNIEPERAGLWYYTPDTDNATFIFNHGRLSVKGDPRKKLGEIVQHYGLPHKIVWEIPRTRYHLASYATYLVYPEHRAFFFAWDKVTWFTANTDFGYSNIFTQEEFDVQLSSLTYADYNQYVESDWPCGE